MAKYKKKKTSKDTTLKYEKKAESYIDVGFKKTGEEYRRGIKETKVGMNLTRKYARKGLGLD